MLALTSSPHTAYALPVKTEASYTLAINVCQALATARSTTLGTVKGTHRFCPLLPVPALCPHCQYHPRPCPFTHAHAYTVSVPQRRRIRMPSLPQPRRTRPLAAGDMLLCSWANTDGRCAADSTSRCPVQSPHQILLTPPHSLLSSRHLIRSRSAHTRSATVGHNCHAASMSNTGCSIYAPSADGYWPGV